MFGGYVWLGLLYVFMCELIGKWMMYCYSLIECYEYIYLNENFYVW